MADISKITASDGVTYNVKDANVPHSSLPAASGGSDLSLVTTGEKYTWNNAGGSNTWEGTQAQYDALPSHDPDTVYYITDGSPIDANLDDLADVSILSPANGDTLKYSSGSWVNSAAEVMQTETSNNSKYEILFSGTADNTTRTEGTGKSKNVILVPADSGLNYTLSDGYSFMITAPEPTRTRAGTLLAKDEDGNIGIMLSGYGYAGVSDLFHCHALNTKYITANEISLPHFYTTSGTNKVGYWKTSSKPVYETIFEFDSSVTLSNNSWTNAIVWTQAIQIVNCIGLSDANGTCFNCVSAQCDTTAQRIKLLNTRGTNITIDSVILTYYYL